MTGVQTCALPIYGGTSPIAFRWSDLVGSGQPQNRTNLAAGTYRVTVSDAATCDTIIQNIVVRDEAINCGGTTCTLVAAVTPTAKSCTEGGKISVQTTGGTAPFNFDWLDLAGTVNDQNRTNLAAGTYNVIITDSRGCDTILQNIIVRYDAVNCGGTTCTLRATVSATPKRVQRAVRFRSIPMVVHRLLPSVGQI